MSKNFFWRTLCCMLCVFLTGFSSSVLADHSWGNYHWERASNPVHLTLGYNFSNGAWDDTYGTAVEDWADSSVLALTQVTGATSPRRCKPDTGKIEVCADTYGNTGWLGVAGISISGSHIVKAYAKMNDTYFSSDPYNTDAWRALVMCQEIGHDFGLGHQDEDFNNPNLNTCMDYTSDPSTNQHPNDHDYAELATIYVHLDGSSGGDGGFIPGCNGNKPGCNSNAPSAINDSAFSGFGPDPRWGNLVQRSLDGHQEVYVLDLGNGHKEITHVTWVESRNKLRR